MSAYTGCPTGIHTGNIFHINGDHKTIFFKTNWAENINFILI